MVTETGENRPGLEGEAGGGPLPPPLPALALLLLELLAESCFFFELLNFTLPESVSFNFSNNLLIGLSMIITVIIIFTRPVNKSSVTATPFTDYCAQTQREQNTDVSVNLVSEMN